MNLPVSVSPVSASAWFTRRRLAYLLLGILVAVLLLVRFNIKGRLGGVFLLEGKGWRLLELKDDLYLGEGSRLIWGIDFGPIRRKVYEKHFPEKLLPSLEVDWDEGEGNGYVVNRYPGGYAMVTSFGRFLADSGEETKGLFVGGGLPESVVGDNLARLNETGMAFSNGQRWLHIWCSTNEVISSAFGDTRMVYPSEWRFLGSRVLHNGPRHVVLSSSHEAVLDGVPLRIDRFAYFHAEEIFFRLGIRIRNEGTRPIVFNYLYGDEPWLGDYGSSKGNVGWTADGLVQRVSTVDPATHRYAGLFDCGNTLVSPRRDFTMSANFIEWLGSNIPDLVYFSNSAGFDADEVEAGVPLASNTRFIGVQWGPRELAPGEETTLFLAVGMATSDPRTGLPVKPAVPIRSELD
ncbi:MAG TPA: hypothetical protein VIU29_00965 [Candidatus Deferrimicrobiaceae bacterium]